MKFSVCIFSRFSKYDGMLLFHQSGDKNAISQKCQLLSAPVLNQKRDQFACLSSVVGSPWIQKNFNISAFVESSAKAGIFGWMGIVSGCRRREQEGLKPGGAGCSILL